MSEAAGDEGRLIKIELPVHLALMASYHCSAAAAVAERVRVLLCTVVPRRSPRRRRSDGTRHASRQQARTLLFADPIPNCARLWIASEPAPGARSLSSCCSFFIFGEGGRTEKWINRRFTCTFRKSESIRGAYDIFTLIQSMPVTSAAAFSS